MFPFEDDIAISMSVTGGSSSGKTVFAVNLFKYHQAMFPGHKIGHFFICYSEWQELYSSVREYCPNVKFIQGLISRDDLSELGQDDTYSLVFIDDLMFELSSSEVFLQSLLSISHHKKVHFIYTLHNIYFQGKFSRTLSLNTKYIVLFINRRDQEQIRRLATQALGKGGSRCLMEAYNDVQKSQKYGYIMLDLSPHSDPKYTLRSKIFPGEDTVVYLMKE